MQPPTTAQMANAALCGSKSEYQRDSKRLKMI
jgi:hypothetical protein